MRKVCSYAIIILMLTLTACHSSRKSAAPSVPSLPEKELPHSAPALAPAADDVAHRIEKEARRWLGTPYKFGGTSRDGVDCSGMVMQVYLTAADIKLPRNSAEQQRYCLPIETGDLSRGDLVFFATTKGGSRVGHVGIYIEDGNFIHASTSRGVMISNLAEPYYVRHYYASGRVPGLKRNKDTNLPKIKKPTQEPQDSREEKNIQESKKNQKFQESQESQIADSIRAQVRAAMKF